MAVKKGGLGKGLSAIFLENENESLGSTVLPVSEIEPNRSQPRRDFDEESLRELADSIAAHGVLQPLLVRPLAEGGYQLVAGERRWRASRMAGLFEVPVIIREMTDSEMMQIAMIENLQRENLNPVEEAMGYRMLIDEYHLTQEEISKSVGKSRPVIANALRILSLPKEILDMVKTQGKLSTVKWYKETHNCGLAEAKNTVDEICAKDYVEGGGNGSGNGNGCSIIVLIGISLTLGALALL